MTNSKKVRVARKSPLFKEPYGVTLTELMVTVAILSVCALGMIASFGAIQRSIQHSKDKSLAANLAQEKLQILKEKNYYELVPTLAPLANTQVVPNFQYDNVNFPPENITEGSVNFQRYTYVQVVDDSGGSGAYSYPGPTTPDTGLKQVTVTVVWLQDGAYHQTSVNNVYGNPNTVMSDASFSGTVTDATTALPIKGALVNMAENIGWRAVTDNGGRYTIHVLPGNMTMITSANGYYTQFLPVSISPNVSITNQNFVLARIASGTITGTAWVNPNVVISQVVVSTVQLDWNSYVAQYVELYNPTQAAVTIGGSPPSIKLNYQTAQACGNPVECDDGTNGIKLIYVSTYVAPGGYYLIASTPTLVINGVRRRADAYYDNPNVLASCVTDPPAAMWNLAATPPLNQIMNIGHGGGVWLSDSFGNVIDALGWMHNANTPLPSQYNGAPWPLGAASATDGMQFVRSSSPSFFDTTQTYGRAYNYGVNTLDFSTFSFLGTSTLFPPYTSTTAVSMAPPVVQFPISGVPPIGAIVSANDGLSTSTNAYAVGFPPYIKFTLTNVATGTWTTLISSTAYTLENDTVTIAATGSVVNFASSSTFLNQPNTHAFITGKVTDVSNNPISPSITISPSNGDLPAFASTANGRYLLRLSSGGAYVDITANPNAANSGYISITSAAVPYQAGAISDDVNFILSQGGRITGFVTRDGTNALPGVAVAFLDTNNIAHDQQISGLNGRFTTNNIDTGTYTVLPALDAMQISSPTSIVVTMAPGQTIFSTTFTITGALGTVSGKVTLGGKPLQTGVLIVVSTAVLGGAPPAPPALSSNSLVGTPYYIGSSNESGAFNINVRQSTNPAYRVYAYYQTVDLNSGAVTVQSQTQTNIQVISGSTTFTSTFAW